MSTNSRLRDLRRRAELVSALGGALFFAMANAACSSSSSSTDTGGPTDTGIHPDASVNMDATMVNPDAEVTPPDSGIAGPVVIDQMQAAAAGGFALPLDAVPDPEATATYFAAVAADGNAAIFKSMAGATTSVVIAEGDPLEGPAGITTSSDGNTVYVADSAAELAAGVGAILSIPATGGTAAAVMGTEGTQPVAVDVLNDNNSDVIYFAGKNPADGAAAVMKISPAGGAITVIKSGDPFTELSGIAVAKDGTVFVADAQGFVYEVPSTGPVTVVLSNLKFEFPAGIALTLDESRLLVSAIDTVNGGDVIHQVKLSDFSDDPFTNSDLMGFLEPGGLHRARNKDDFAWADRLAGATGTVYHVTTHAAP